MIPERWLEQIAERWAAMSGWELAAVVLAVTYLLLAVRQNRLCWIAAFVSTTIFTVLFWNVQLLMQSALNVYYMAMAVYGWWHWRHGEGSEGSLPITRWRLSRHALALGVIAACALVSGYLLTRHSQAAWPYLDSLVTWGAVVTTFMVARKVLENWSYWMVINSLAIFLFIDRGMALTATLHASYLVISVFGWISWHRDYRQQATAQEQTGP
ncbi:MULTISPECIES: nicotinamide riboside transporter PnuC [unclassified Wenzhouxiangella]|uniref:nicotinamide riboside transporter PnuC n=1 Tax=unclassified Wenzhouxiangella TaxID=2613841 RepID=UPI0015F279A9|nr:MULTISPECIES: nicotinamide riboside transporter PnuC [unclassified Wenzhouxiangella]